MNLRLQERLVHHRAEAGAARERVVRDFLSDHLPRRFLVANGFIFDADGLVSDQLDVIIADSMVSPRFEAAEGVFFFPCESVVAVGQIKTNCDSRRKAWDALSNLRSATLLDRSSKGEALCERTGVSLSPEDDHLSRIFTFLLVVDDALESDTMLEVVQEYIYRSDPHTWPSIIVALNRYLMTYACESGACPNTLHARGLAISDESHDASVFVQFYTYLSQAVQATRVSRIQSWPHLGTFANIHAHVVVPAFQASDKPPALLSELRLRANMGYKYPFDSTD